MFKRNQIQSTIVLAGVTLVSCAALAQQNETTTATVTVQNAFTIVEDTPLSFGTITATRTSGTASVYVVKADGTTVAPTGTIRSLVPGSPATYTISGAASFTELRARVNVTTVELINSNAPGDNPTFTVSDFTVTDGTNTGNVTSAAVQNINLTTDVSGGMSLGVGAQMAVTPGADDTYLDGDYEGTFTITLQY